MRSGFIPRIEDGEMDGDDTTKHPQMRSRRFPIKPIFMGVVGRPRPDKNFDGRIFLERISKIYIGIGIGI